MKVGMNKCSEANSSSTALLDSLPILTLALQFRATPAGRRSSSSRTEKEDILSGVYVKQPLESVQHLSNCSALCADCSRPASALIHNGTSCLPYRSVHHSQTYVSFESATAPNLYQSALGSHRGLPYSTMRQFLFPTVSAGPPL